jgi:hypothetical protein
MMATLGFATILGGAQKSSGTTATVHVRLSGSPAAVPTGTVVVTVTGTQQSQTVPLLAGQADLTLTNIPGDARKISISYSGDSHYVASKQDLAITAPHTRAVRH